uniref:ABC1 atypical kinase-like domain-containing protein n=1 Tax=Acrobeloides nanus TaxID=290746 RepID=A0A914C0R5_9BILA
MARNGRNDLNQILKTLQILAQSQIGYEARQTQAKAKDELLRLAVNGGAATFARLLSSGIYPGSGGYVVEHEAVTSAIPVPEVMHESSAPLSTPTVEITTSAGISPEEEAYLIKAAREVGVIFPKPSEPKLAEVHKPKVVNSYRPRLPKEYSLRVASENVLEESRERAVPSSRISRLASFGNLAFGLSMGAAAEVTRRTFGWEQAEADTKTNPFLTPANAERIVSTLCRVRGAALKLGQMLSIQDFEEKPFAAASIGQVHRAITLDGKKVAIKIQYPGVAEGIDSDIDNLVSVLNLGGIFPKGMFLDTFTTVARRELKAECDYEREARAANVFRRLLANDPDFYVPQIYSDLSSKRVLTAEYIEGISVDKCVNEPQAVRDYIAGKFIELCLKEIFVWRFMQTDPNWSNFFLGKHPSTGDPRLILLDFGASRSYQKKFVDQYMHIIRAAYDEDREKMLKYSRKIGFLTGYESKVMEQAHCESISILGETLSSNKPYDFSAQDVTRRIHKLIPIMLEHRLTSPPEEIYSLHRKLSGSYLLATKLKAVVSCGPIFEEIYSQYKFGENGSEDIDIEDNKMNS